MQLVHIRDGIVPAVFLGKEALFLNAAYRLAVTEMVVAYVTDGSGTKDMIERAESQLKAVLR